MSAARGVAPDRAFSLARWRPVFVDDLMRIGRPHDGGYVVSRRSVQAAELLVGLGVNDDWSFEEDFQRYNPAVRVVGIDGSVSEEVFRERATRARIRSLGHLVRLQRWNATHYHREAMHWRARARAFRAFFSAGNRAFHQRYISDIEDGDNLTWSGLRGVEPALTGDDTPRVFVKIDIEGAEYRVLSQVLEDARRITGLVIEFHDCGVMWDRFAALMARMEDQFAVVHVHGNNWMPLIPGAACPTTLEVSLLSRVLLPDSPVPSRATYPIAGLDMPNHPERPDYPLAF